MEGRFARENPDASKGGGGNAILSRQSRGGAARRWGEGSVRAGVWRETPFSPTPPRPAPSHWDNPGEAPPPLLDGAGRWAGGGGKWYPA